MTIASIRPESDVAVAWYGPIVGDHYIQIDNVVTYPTIGGTNDTIANDGWLGSDNVIDDFNFEDLSDVDEVTSITIYTIGNIWKFGATSYYPELQYSINGGSSWSAVHDCTGHGIGTPPDVYDWVYDVWTISGLSWTQAQINAIRVRAIADTPNGDKNGADVNMIALMYISVTYTPTAAGYGHDYMGVPAANIGSVNGVPTANIASINGV